MQNNTFRPVEKIIQGIPTTDGAGVRLTRIIGTPELNFLDPFLLLDEFKSEDSDDYLAGFPDHPHRGFETVTYLLAGKFRHKDSKGHEGILTSGCVQWMTAGRGIIHSEMPEMTEGLVWGYQLWINLPAKLKMVEPRYQHIEPQEIPHINDNGVQVKVIAGKYKDAQGPGRTRFPTSYMDVQMAPHQTFTQPAGPAMNCFCYIYEGSGSFSPLKDSPNISKGQLVVLGKGETVQVNTQAQEVKFLFLAANRLNEPVARGGPFVMNTKEEITQAALDYQNGTLHL